MWDGQKQMGGEMELCAKSALTDHLTDYAEGDRILYSRPKRLTRTQILQWRMWEAVRSCHKQVFLCCELEKEASNPVPQIKSGNHKNKYKPSLSTDRSSTVLQAKSMPHKMRAVSKETNQCRRLTQPFISVNKDNRSVGNSGFSNILSSRSTWAMRLKRGEALWLGRGQGRRHGQRDR